MGDLVLWGADRFVSGVVRREDPVVEILGDAFDGFGTVGGGAEFGEVDDDGLAVAAGCRFPNGSSSTAFRNSWAFTTVLQMLLPSPFIS